MAPAGGLHGQTANTVAFLLTAQVRRSELGKVFSAETGFIVSRDPDTVRAPDVAFVSQERLPPGQVGTGFLELAPDLVVEVVSPGDTAAHVQEKVQMWLKAGSRLAWVVYPESQSVVVYRSLREATVLHTGDDLDGAPVLEDFNLPVSDLFE